MHCSVAASPIAATRRSTRYAISSAAQRAGPAKFGQWNEQCLARWRALIADLSPEAPERCLTMPHIQTFGEYHPRGWLFFYKAIRKTA